MRKIHLNESSLVVLTESKKMTFLKFYKEVVAFVKGLLNELLLSVGLTNGKLRQLLSQFGIVVKSENIDEPINDESGKKESKYHLSYKVPKENFKDKIRKLYSHEKLDEIDE